MDTGREPTRIGLDAWGTGQEMTAAIEEERMECELEAVGMERECPENRALQEELVLHWIEVKSGQSCG